MSKPVRAVGALAALAFSSVAGGATPPVRADLVSDWRTYLDTYVQDDGRVIDHSRDAITTSEGQAYGLLRAAWLEDRKAFDRIRRWTRRNLQGGDPSALPAWKWGRSDDDRWGILDPQPAADADLLYAYALLLGAERFGRAKLARHARGLLGNVWEQEVRRLGERWVLLPGPWAIEEAPVSVNPSYFLPFVYRAAAEVDADHDWAALLDDTYDLLDELSGHYSLPPDWFWMDAATGELVEAPGTREHGEAFGYEALRLPWALEAEVTWFGEVRAQALLMWTDHLATRFASQGRIVAIIDADGTAVADWESRALYGSLLPSWVRLHGDKLDAVLERIDALAVPSVGGQGHDYYAANWVWFGKALWAGVAVPLDSS